MVCSTLNRSIHQKGDEGGDMQNETGSNVKSRVPHAYALPHSQVLGFPLEETTLSLSLRPLAFTTGVASRAPASCASDTRVRTRRAEGTHT